jgi:hypothetical protein
MADRIAPWLKEANQRIADYADDCMEELYKLADRMNIENYYAREYFIKHIQNSGDKDEV